MNTQLLTDGLTIIAACREQTNDIWDAHYGAAAIGSALFASSGWLSPQSAARVEAQAAAMVKATLDPAYAAADSDSGCEETTAATAILDALDSTIGELHWVGHPVIYSASSLLAIHQLQRWGSSEQLSGLTALIRAFERTIPGRSWIGYSAAEVRRMQVTVEDGFPTISHPRELSTLVLEQLAAFPVIYRAEAHHDLMGHMLTYAHALNILFDLGHVSFFERGVPPLLKLVKVLRSSIDLPHDDPVRLVSPVDRLPLQPAQRGRWLPTDERYWQRDYSGIDWDFGHVFKFAHSFYDHLGRVSNRKPAYEEQLRYLIVP
ncbi:hypothetical protein PA598K_03768 [Paenibacillus sp. 598K]|uniref:hypothetical protein n=1 Tax=Paenibacillus sp. 598K TaxID=1117987 RepID=UPI000FF93776|nr:hypothetical protein [Paenibacillus sp. 598K]GBF75365.1 hypothetical protein PA598K_03768 [Paenibacillus sp. 598K]